VHDVGIVMPVYKQDPHYLELAIKSILQQTYRNYHFVIVTDGAPAETVNQINRLILGDSRVQLIIKDKNDGVAKTLNIGFESLIKNNEVKYLTWVSSDNIYYSTFVEKLRDALENAPANIGLSYSSFRHIDDQGKYLKEPALEEFYKYQNQPKENLLDVCFIGVSFMYKKDIAAVIEGYWLEPVEDYEYWLRLTEKCEITYVEEALMEYRTTSLHSISAKLKGSKEQHRKWRFAFNLARQQARNRRNIPFALTVVYPLYSVTQQIINKLEDLLEQSFSNYKLIIVDCTIDQNVQGKLKDIADPRLSFIGLPGATVKEAVKKALTISGTLYTIVYGISKFPTSPLALYDMILRGPKIQNQKEEIMVLEDMGYRKVIARRASQPAEILTGHLYQTKALRKILNL
jgi:glycosyltransferase involved in cell wall biosynthesis